MTTGRLTGLLLAMASTTASAAEPRTVDAVDLGRYQGTWYEQAHLPLFFQRKCARDTTATYTLRKDGRVDVVNRCGTADGGAIEAVGVARSVSDSNAKLKVRFAPAFLSALPFVWGDYWILELDPEYRWALVGSPDRKYLWILSRDRQLAPDIKQRLLARAKADGYALDQLIETPQTAR